MGDHFFAAAGLAADQDGGTGFAEISDLLPDLPGRSALSDKVGDTVFYRSVLFTGIIHGVEGILEV